MYLTKKHLKPLKHETKSKYSVNLEKG